MSVNEFLKSRKLILQVASFWPDDYKSGSFLTKLNAYRCTVVFINLTVLQILGLCTVATPDISPEYFVDLLGFLTTIIKHSAIIYNRQKVWNLFSEMEQFERRSHNADDAKIVEFWMQLQNTLTKYVLRGYFVMFIFYFVAVFFTTDKVFPLKLMFRPNSIFSPWYEVIYVCEIFIFLHITCTLIASDSYFIIFMCQFCKELQLIKMLLLKSKEGDHKLLRSFIKKHSSILIFGDKICNVLTSSVFGQCCVISLLLCFCSYLSVMDINSVVKMRVYWVAVLGSLTLFVMCLAGEMVTDMTLDIGDTLMECKIRCYQGGHENVKNLKNINFVLQRAQKPLQISMGTFGTVNMKFFCSIMRNVYSISLLLRTAYS